MFILALIVSPVMTSSAESYHRKFIAHRGVNLRSTIAGENSLEAIRLAARAGFDAIETDVRLTADDSLVVMHDATLNRTCLNADGSPITADTKIADLKYDELSSYKLKADSARMQTAIPLLADYLSECRDNGLFTFIEPKLVDPTGRYYRRIIVLADSVFGKNNYVITSNNKANIIIRDSLGIKDVPLMGILYQTTFPEIERLGNVIMAISASKIKDPAYSGYVDLSVSKGLKTESHADRFEHFAKIDRNRIDYISTDFLAPDFSEDMHVGILLDTPVILNGDASLEKGAVLEFPTRMKVAFGAAYLDMEFDGKLKITLGNQTFVADGGNPLNYRVMLYESEPVLIVEALSRSVIRKLNFKTVDF